MEERRRIALAIREHRDKLTPKQLDYASQYYLMGVACSYIAQRAGVNRSTVSRTIERAVLRLVPQIFLDGKALGVIG